MRAQARSRAGLPFAGTWQATLHVTCLSVHVSLHARWALVTLMTVGYGDYFPITAGGKAVACITMMAGGPAAAPSTVGSAWAQLRRRCVSKRLQLCVGFKNLASALFCRHPHARLAHQRHRKHLHQ
jgi:hypothetical protein